MKKIKEQIRAVIDTNLFVSGLFADQGTAFQLQELQKSNGVRPSFLTDYFLFYRELFLASYLF